MSRFLTLHDPAAARTYHAAGLWRGETHYDLLVRHAQERPEAFALRDSSRRLTYADLLGWVDAAADDLHGVGVRPGERVSLWLSNRVETVVAYLACARNGYACNPSLHRNYTTGEIVSLLERIGATAIFTEDGWSSDTGKVNVAAELGRLKSLRKIYTLPAARGEAGDVPPHGALAKGLVEPVSNADAVSYLAFTSGTTSTPKCVMHSHNTLLANARDLVKDWGHGPETVLMSLSPLSHHIAWVAVAQCLIAGGEFVVDDPPKGMTKLDWIMETGATYVMGVPTHAIDMLAQMAERGLDRLGNVSVFYMAGAPIPPATAEAFVKQGTTPQNVYGMTENSSHQYTHPNDEQETICHTCGRGGPAYEIRIFDQEHPDRDIGRSTVGQIGGRGAALMLGYFDNQRATEQSFNRDGWFLSGDLGMIDDKGHLHVVGRLKDVIIRGGHNIHPARIEHIAVKHPDIDKAAAFPVADERLGEKVCLAVLPLGDETPQADDVLAHLDKGGLSKYDMPEYFLVLDAFPLTVSGKILKRELADWAKQGEISPKACRFGAVEGD